MCGKNECGCDRTQRPPERKPEKCTPDQIKACHGEAQEHPCESEEKGCCEEKGSCCE